MRKILSLTLALVLTLALAVPAFAAVGFSDVLGSHWAYDDIMTCAEAGIVKGYEDGSFHPGENVTGIQFIVMMTRTFFNDEVEAAQQNASGKAWYWPYTSVAEEVKLSHKATIDDNAINRYDMAQVLYNELRISGKYSVTINNDKANAATSSIKDWQSVASDHQMAVKHCYSAGILTGMSDGTFSGEQSMTRAQACAVIVRMMNLIGGSEPAAPVTPVTPTQPEQPTQPQQPEPPEQTTTGKLANGKDITSENVLEILEEIKKEYPDGTIWGEQGTANNNYYAAGSKSTDVRAVVRQVQSHKGGYSSTEYGCGGWAAMVSDRIFGQTGFPAHEVTDASKVRAGDIIISYNSAGKLTHVAIASSDAYEAYGYYGFTTCDGNAGGGLVMWGTGHNSLGVKSYGTIRAYTRYPD